MAEAKTEKKAASKKATEKAAKKTVVISTAAKQEETALAAGSVKLTLRKGLMGCSEKQKAVVASLGLRRVGDVSVQPDNAPTAGKIAKIGFLLDVSRA